MRNWLVILLLFFVCLPVGLVFLLCVVPPPFTAFMLQSEVRPVQYQWVPASRIAETARKAVVAAEDQKFWTHKGFDFEAMDKAYRDNRKRRHKRGASTISQQTAKNLFLWPGGGYFRKGIEAGFTVLMEKLWSKQRILEVYLNIVEFGPGIYGVEAAAQKFFGKHASELSPGEAARLAAVLPNPKRWDAARPGAYVMSRTAWILGQMGYRAAGRPVPAEEPEEPPEETPQETSVEAQPAGEAQEPGEEQGSELPPETPPEQTTVPGQAPAESGETGSGQPSAGEMPMEEGRQNSGGQVTEEPAPEKQAPEKQSPEMQVPDGSSTEPPL